MAEMLEVMLQNGEPTGQVLEKAIIHDHSLWHRDVHVWVTDGQNFLQQQRAHDKSLMPGAWDISVGGHVPVGESYLDAGVRETAEELGLHLPSERFLPIGMLAVDIAFGDQGKRHRTVGQNFVVVEKNLSLDRFTAQRSELAGLRLYAIDQLEADLQDPETAQRHAPQPLALWQLGIAGMRRAAHTA